MSAEAICPHCGFDLQTVQTVRLGDWTAFRTGEIAYRDAILPFRSEARVAQALMRAYPNPLKVEVLADRMGWSDASLYVAISRARRVLRQHGAPMMIGRRCGVGVQHGYFWNCD